MVIFHRYVINSFWEGTFEERHKNTKQSTGRQIFTSFGYTETHIHLFEVDL